MLLHEDITSAIIEAAVRVHAALGPGLLESAYETCICHELAKARLKCLRQVALPVIYDGQQIDAGYRIDLLVEDAVIVELKCVERIAAIHEAQLHTYFRLSGKRVGLILNFNSVRMRDGIVRRVL